MWGFASVAPIFWELASAVVAKAIERERADMFG